MTFYEPEPGTRYHTPTAAEMNEALHEQLAEETEMDREADAEYNAPRYTLAGASDRHVVWLRDVTGAPPVARPYSSILVVPVTVKIVYERERPGAAWALEFLGVDGWRAKKDGTAGQQQAEAHWSYSDARKEDRIPAWLAQLIENYRPTTDALIGYYAPDPTVETPVVLNPDWRIW